MRKLVHFQKDINSNLDIANNSYPFCSLYPIIHYIKCNMLSKSPKWELVFVHYIAKFYYIEVCYIKVWMYYFFEFQSTMLPFPLGGFDFKRNAFMSQDWIGIKGAKIIDMINRDSLSLISLAPETLILKKGHHCNQYLYKSKKRFLKE